MKENGGSSGQAVNPGHRKRRGAMRRWAILRWARRLGVLVALLLILVAGLYFTRERTLHPLLVRWLPRMCRALGPYEVSVEDIEGDWRSGLTLTSVRVKALQPDLALRSVQATTVEVEGSLFQAVWEGDIESISRLSLEEPRVVIDTTVPPGADTSKPGASAALPRLPRIEIQRGELAIRTKAEVLRLGDVTVAGQGDPAEPWALSLFFQADHWSGAVEGRIHQVDPESSTLALAFDLDVPSGVARGVDIAVGSLEGIWSLERLTLDRGTVTAGRNRLTIDGVRFSGAGADAVAGGRVGFKLDDLDAARRAVSAFIDPLNEQPKTWSGSATGSIELVEAPGQFATGSVRISGQEVVIEGVELGAVETHLDVDRGAVTITELQARTSEGTMLDGSGSYLFEERELVDVELGVRMETSSTLSPSLTWVRGVNASLLFSGPLDRPSGRVTIQADRLVAAGTPLSRVQANGTLDQGVLLLEDGRADTEYGTIRLGGRIVLPIAGAELDLRLEQLELSSGVERLALLEPAQIALEGQTVRIAGLKLAGSAGELAVDFEGGGGAPPQAQVSFKGLRPTPFLGPKLSEWLGSAVDPGSLDGTFEYSSSPFSASADITVTADPLRLVGERSEAKGIAEPIRGTIRGAWDGAKIDIQALKVEMPGAHIDLTAHADLEAQAAGLIGNSPLDPSGDLAIKGSFQIEEACLSSPLAALALGANTQRTRESARGALGGTLDLAGTWGAPSGTISLTGEGLEWINQVRSNGAWVGKGLLPKPVRFDTRVAVGPQMTIESGALELVDSVRLDVGGSLAAGLDLAGLVSSPQEWVNRLLDATFDGRATLASENLEELSALAPELREISGQISGELRLAGQLRSPSVTGEVKVTEAGARIRGAPLIEHTNVDIVFEQGQVRVTRGSLELGASPVRFEGNLLLGRGIPRVDAKIFGDEVLLVRTADARIRADLKLELSGLTNALVLGGEVNITGGRVRSPFEFQSLLEGGGGSPRSVTRGFKIPAFGPASLRLDTRVVTTKPLSLQGRIARGGIRTDLRLQGTAAEPTPVGSIFFDPLELAVPAGTIVFPSGVVQFDRNSPEIPRIDIVGTTRLAGYDVTVSVEGDYDQPTAELSSSPSLPSDDLLLLVLSGQPPTTGGGLGAAGQSVALYVAKDLVRGWFSSGGFKDEDRESFLDRLQVVTGRDVSRSGILTIEATYKLREGLAREKDAIYLVLERDSYEDYGLGLRLVLRLR